MRRIGLALAGAGLAAALTACGGGDGDGGDSDSSSDGSSFADQSAEEIVADAKAAMDELDAVKVTGSVTTGGQDIDLDIQANGEGDCTGSIGIAGGQAELLGVGGETWFKPDKAFWEASAPGQADQIIAVVGDRWVVVPPGTGNFDQFCDVDGLLEEMISTGDDSSTYTKAGTEELDGAEVIRIDNEDEEEGTSSGYVLADEPHYLVKVEKTEGEDTGSVTFSQFNEEFTVEAPAEDEVIDLDQLG